MKSGMKERTGGGVRSAGCAAVPAMPSGSGSAAAGDAPWGCGRRAGVGQSRPWGGLGAAVGSVGLGPGGVRGSAAEGMLPGRLAEMHA